MIEDIIVIVICLSLILIFRQVDKKNSSLEKVKKFSNRVLADFDEYFKKEGIKSKNAGIELDVKQSQAIAAVKRLEQNIEAVENHSAEFAQKLSIVGDAEKRLSNYETAIQDLFEMTERVEENLEKIRNHSTLVNKVSKQLDGHQNRLTGIEKRIPNIMAEFEKQNNERINTIGAEFSSWVEQRFVDIQTLADSAVDKNESLLDEIAQVYDKSFALAAQKADNLEGEVFEKLTNQVQVRSEQFEDILSRSTQDLSDYVEREKTEIEQTIIAKIDKSRTFVDDLRQQFQNEADSAMNESREMMISFINEQEQKLSSAIENQDEHLQSTLSRYKEQTESAVECQQQHLNAELNQLVQKTTDEIARQEGELLVFNENFARTEEIINHMDGKVLVKQQENKELLERLQQHLDSNSDNLAKVFDEKTSNIEHELENAISSLQKSIIDNSEKLSVGMNTQYNEIKSNFDSRLLEMGKQLVSDRNETLRNNNERTVAFFKEVDSQIDDAKKDMEYRFERLAGIGKDIDSLEDNFRRLVATTEKNLVGEVDSFHVQFKNEADFTLAEVTKKIADSIVEQKQKIVSELTQQQTDVNVVLEETDRLLSLMRDDQNEKLDSVITQQNKVLEAKISHQNNELSVIFAEHEQRVAAELSSRQEELNVTIVDANKLLNAMTEEQKQKLSSAIEYQDEHIQSTLSHYKEQSESAVEQQQQHFVTELNQLAQKTADEIARQKEELSTFGENFARDEEIMTNLGETIHAKQQESQELLECLQQHLESNFNNLSKNFDEKSNVMKNEFEGVIFSLRKNIIDNSEKLSTGMTTRYDEIKSNFDSRLLEMDKLFISAREEVLKNNKGKAAVFFEEVDKRIDDAKKDMEYRFERLESVGKDIDSLESNFRRLMQTAEQRLLGEFETFKDARNNVQTEFEAETNDSFNNMKRGLEALDNELNSLKTRAYDNVSEKLQLFEDDFFGDLNNRSETLSASLVEWKEGFDARLSGIGNNLEENRLLMESKYSEELKEHFATTQEKYREQLSRLEENLKKTEYNFSDRMGSMETTLRSFIDLQRTQIDSAKQAAEEYLKTELETQGQVATEQLKRYEREISSQLHQLSQSVAVTQEETTGSLESVLGELTSWRERLDTQFEENRALYTDKLTALQQTSGEQIAQVQQIFASDVDDYTNLAREERAHITTELNELKTQSKSALKTYEVRTTEMLEEFKKAYESMLEDTQRRIRSENSDAEQKLRALKSMVQEVREKNESAQEKIVLKIQTEANILTMNMDDIDKRLKQFVAQTQLFEKVDEMRNTLENQMGDLRNHMARFDNFKQITDSIELQFVKIRKLDDDAASKLQRFSNEKNRVDALETDFNKLINLSTSMDQKIAELKNTSDDLQVLQMEVRRFQETLGDISGRYDRLEKKNTVLDQTILGVDRTFEGLRELEERLLACSQQTIKMPAVVDSLRRDLTNLMENSQGIGEVMDKLGSLDAILAQTNEQVEDIQKAREWIVRTEARLGEMTKEAKEQVNLFGALMKGGANKNNAGAPVIAVRENVIKLAHQGWKTDQIAASLNLTIGEVELILDFYGKEER